MIMSKILKSAELARYAHSEQVRKFSGLPYVSHVGRVAGRVSVHKFSTEDMIAAAFCHDILEDTRINYEELSLVIGKNAANIVLELTNPSKNSSLSRSERKRMDRDHIVKISKEARIIKFFDRIDNISELLRDYFLLSKSEKEFSAIYAYESRLLLDVLNGLDEDLEAELLFVIEGLEKNISQGKTIMA